MTAAIRAEGDAAHIVVGGKHVGGYRLQMADWHQAKAIGLMFLDRLTSVLSQIAEPVTDVPAPTSTADQLATLAVLRDRGFLTEAEFEAEKKRLLS